MQHRLWARCATSVGLLGALMLATACDPAPGSSWPGTTEDRDGVVWVHNPAADADSATGAPPFALKLEQTFGAELEPADAQLSFVTSVAVDSSGNVYAVDAENNRLVAFGPGGNMRWSGGQAGQGPGEFEFVNSVAWDGAGLLYVSNRGGSQVDTWTTAGEYVSTQGLAELEISPAYVVGLPDPDTLVLRSWSRVEGDGAIVHVFDISDGWRQTAEFFALGGRLAATDEVVRWGNAPVRVGADHLWVGNRISYEVREYGLDGTLRRVIAREDRQLIPTFVYRGTGFGMGGFAPPLWFSQGHGLVPRHWTVGLEDAEDLKRRWDEYWARGGQGELPIEYDSAIDLIDAEGRVLGSLPLDGTFEQIGNPELTGPDGRLYTLLQDPYPHIRRYRVELAELAAGSRP